MAYSDFEKAEAFKDTLEVTFQENEEPYCDDKIEVENLVDETISTTSPHARPSHFTLRAALHCVFYSGFLGDKSPPLFRCLRPSRVPSCVLPLAPPVLCFDRAFRALGCQVIYSQFGLAIYRNDHQARRRFVECAQNEIAVVPDFHKRILFSDEAHFWLNGYVNKQNCRIWSEANPQVYVETPLHPEKLTVWCALWAGGILLQNDEGHNVTVNGDRYRTMITNFFIPELNNHDVQELWFQQDGATCHTARATIDLLKDTFGDRLISRFGPVNWPRRSCDLTPLDYFLWGYVKSWVYADKPQTLDHLEDNIRRVTADIRPQMLEKVIENWTTFEPAVAVLCQKSYLKFCFGKRGGNFIFDRGGSTARAAPDSRDIGTRQTPFCSALEEKV
ncbi:putative DD41D transposase [Trichonephila clavipes]|nr:putative DD41D transposase [Trichonephila clavipes]